MSKDPIKYAHWAYSNYSLTRRFELSEGKNTSLCFIFIFIFLFM